MDPAASPLWTAYLGEGSLAAYQGAAHYELAIADRLRVLDTVLEPLHASPGVAELRGRLVATAA